MTQITKSKDALPVLGTEHVTLEEMLKREFAEQTSPDKIEVNLKKQRNVLITDIINSVREKLNFKNKSKTSFVQEVKRSHSGLINTFMDKLGVMRSNQRKVV